MKTIKLLKFNVFYDNLSVINFHEKIIINTLNASAVEWSKKDKLYYDALISSDILLPDGISILITARLLQKKSIVKISGEDIFFYLINKLKNEGGSCFFLGSSSFILEKISQRMILEYPSIYFSSFSPPYKDCFNDTEKKQIIKVVNDFAPNVLFVGISAPKQEKLIYEIKESLNVNVICNIGAVFEFFAGTIKRPAVFWQKLGLEWIITWFIDPKRLRKKEYINIIKFIITLIKEKML